MTSLPRATAFVVLLMILHLLTGESVATGPLDELESLGYQPLGVVSAPLRLAGSTTLQQAAALWSEGFHAIHPDATIAIDSSGSDAGWRALLAGEADIALLSRPVGDADRVAFTAAAAMAAKTLVVLPVGFERFVWIVNEANPIEELRWSPETGVMAAEAGDAAGEIAWDRLGAADEQANVLLRVHATELGSGTRWHLDHLLTGSTAGAVSITEHPTIKAIAEAVAADRGGLGLIGENDGTWPGVRPLSLTIPAEATPAADAVPGSERSPDCRPLFIALAVPQDGEWPAVAREFVAYVLSWQGQLDVAQDGLLPLSRAEILAQREILGGPVER